MKTCLQAEWWDSCQAAFKAQGNSNKDLAGYMDFLKEHAAAFREATCLDMDLAEV